MGKTIVFVLLILLASCEMKKKPKMEDNFNIIIKDQNSLINIGNREYRRRYTAGDSLVLFELNSEEINKIFNLTNQYDIFEMDNNYNPWGYQNILPVLEIDVTVINGSETRNLHIKNAIYFFRDNKKVKQIRRLATELNAIIYSKKSVLSLPPSDLEYE